jgi:hypothetical protein
MSIARSCSASAGSSCGSVRPSSKASDPRAFLDPAVRAAAARVRSCACRRHADARPRPRHRAGLRSPRATPTASDGSKLRVHCASISPTRALTDAYPPHLRDGQEALQNGLFTSARARASRALRSMVRKGSPAGVRQRDLALRRGLRVSVAVHLRWHVHSASKFAFRGQEGLAGTNPAEGSREGPLRRRFSLSRRDPIGGARFAQVHSGSNRTHAESAAG